MPDTPSRLTLFSRTVLTCTLAVAVAGSAVAIGNRSNDYGFFSPLIDVKDIGTLDELVESGNIPTLTADQELRTPGEDDAPHYG